MNMLSQHPGLKNTLHGEKHTSMLGSLAISKFQSLSFYWSRDARAKHTFLS